MVPAAIIVVLAAIVNLILTIILWTERTKFMQGVSGLDERQKEVERSMREVVAWVKLPPKTPEV